MQALARLCVRRPVFASVLILSLVVVGLVGYGRLGVDRYPKVDFPTITVSTRLPGLSEKVMDKTVRVTEGRLQPAGATVCSEQRVPHAPDSSVSDQLFDRGLCLPSGSNLTDHEQDRIIDAISDCVLAMRQHRSMSA